MKNIDKFAGAIMVVLMVLSLAGLKSFNIPTILLGLGVLYVSVRLFQKSN